MKSVQNPIRSLPPLSLYVHIPWCVKKCPYCDFNSHTHDGELPVTAYVDALKRDLAQDAGYAQGRKLQSIFFGGGTPSLFPGAAIATIIQTADDLIGFVDDIEITLEANPGTTEHHSFRDMLAAGVNRLSLGVQSFNDAHLSRLGRIHNAGDARKAVEAAQNAGFENINLDLMHGLPEQSLEDAMADLRQGIALNTPHLSWYQLTIEKNTRFYSMPPVLPNEEVLWDIHQHGLNLLREHGFERYEVSAFCRSGKQAKHNLNYWRFGDYIGIGAGAHGKISDGHGVFRTAKTRQPSDYLARTSAGIIATTRVIQSIDENNLIADFMLNALRLREGTSLAEFSAHTGIDAQRIQTKLRDLRTRGLLSADENRIAASAKGYDFLDSILQEFLPD